MPYLIHNLLLFISWLYRSCRPSAKKNHMLDCRMPDYC